MSANDLFDRLGDLSPEDLRQVRARVEFLLPAAAGRSPAVKGRAAPDHAGMVHKEMAASLRGFGVRSVPPPGVILRSPYAKDFRDGVAALVAYATEYLAPATRPELVLAVRVLLGVVTRRMQERRVPITLVSLCRALKAVEAAVEYEFPGYRASGLLAAVLNPRTATGAATEEEAAAV